MFVMSGKLVMEARRSLLCVTSGCKYMKNTDYKNNGGTHCCKKCKDEGVGKHGDKCQKNDIKFMKCDREDCSFVKNPDIFNNGGTHCCNFCKKNQPLHGGLCTKSAFVPVDEVKEEKVDVVVLEEIHGIDYPHYDVKVLPCGSLKAARIIASTWISRSRNLFAGFDKHKKKIWIKKLAHVRHPKVKKGVINHNVTLFYFKKFIGMEKVKCKRSACNFMKDPYQDHGFCCRMCVTDGSHGPLCKKQEMGIKGERLKMKCARPGCRFMRHEDIKNNGGTHCCRDCKLKGYGRHGGLCAKIHVGKVMYEGLRCDRPGCQLVTNPDLKNNGGTHCCYNCKNKGSHGDACTKKSVREVLKDVATGSA